MSDTQPEPTPVRRSSFVTDDFMKITPSLVRELGGDMVGAGVLVMIEYRARIYGIDRDGYRWWTASRDELANDTGLRPRQVDGAIERLLKKGRIIKQKFGQRRSNHTLSYRILYDDGGSMPTLHTVAASHVTDRGDEANADVTDRGDEANADVTDRGDRDLPDRGNHDLPDPGDLLLTKKEKKGGEGSPPRPDRCEAHRGLITAPPCGGCRDAREDYEARTARDQEMRRHRDIKEYERDKAQRLADRLTDIKNCRICNDEGRCKDGMPCDHDPAKDRVYNHGYAFVRAEGERLGIPMGQAKKIPA